MAQVVQPQPDGGRNTETLEERIRLLEERLSQLQHEHDRRPGALFRRLVPPEVRAHLRAAQRERLLAARAMIDVALKRTQEQPAERSRRVESVRIE